MSRQFKQRFWNALIWHLTVMSMILNLLFPTLETLKQAWAQETTPEPTPEVTPEATPTSEPSPEVTPEATPEVTPEATPVPTEEATAAPTDAPVLTETPALPTLPAPTAEVSLFVDNFQDAGALLAANGWTLSGGWSVGSELNSDGTTNYYLSAAATGTPETAALPQLQWDNLTLAARVRVHIGDSAGIAVRAGLDGYTVVVHGSGSVQLYRGGLIVAEGPAVATPEPVLPDSQTTETPAVPPVWRTLNIHLDGAAITVLLEGVEQFTYTDPNPAGAGTVAFSTGALNTGITDFDDLYVTRLQPMVQATPEATLEATAEATAEATPEAPPVNALLREDFEGDLSAWNAGADVSIITADETNHALLMPALGTLSPLDSFVLGDFQLDARVKLIAPEGLTITLRDGYVLTIDATQIGLARGETVLATSQTAHELGVWHDVSATLQGDHLVINVNGSVEIDAVDPQPTPVGGIGFAAFGAAMLDDILVIDLTPAEVLAEVTPSPTPLGIDQAVQLKLDSALLNLLNVFLSGDPAATAEVAAIYGIFMDDQGRVRVSVRAANYASGETLRPFIEGVGGIVERVVDNTTVALIPPMGVIALVSTAEVEVILLPDAAVSTDYSLSNAQSIAAAVGSVVPQSLDFISVPDWDAAGIRGANVDIALIDSTAGGFVGAVPGAGGGGGNQQCLYNNPGGATNHGTNVVDVICDVAPNSRVFGFLASDAATLKTTLNGVRLSNTVAGITGNTYDIILITLDLGAHTSAGDGTGVGLSTANDFYAEISAARASGILVVVSAGNNGGRYQTFTLNNGGSATVNLTAVAGSRVNLSWSAWSTSADISATLSGTGSKPARGSGIPGHSFAAVAGAQTLNVTNNSGGTLTIQVQVTGAGSSIGTISGATYDANAGTLGRPADSPDALTVGAVCATQASRYPRLADTSVGPAFAAGGLVGALPTSGSAIKPDVVAPSHVSTSQTTATNCNAPLTDNQPNIAAPTDGFNGTSAAAAHVAGIAALLRSNTTNTSMSTRFGPGLVSAPAALEQYIQTHTVELFPTTTDVTPGNDLNFLGTPDGWDRIFGAGLTMLGSPTFNMADVQNFSTTVSTATANDVYVGQGNTASTQVGDLTNPYLSIAHAIAANPSKRIIVMSGEYVSGINVIAAGTTVISYDAADVVNRPDTSIWVNDNYSSFDIAFGETTGGFSINNIDNVTIEGFIFNAAHPLKLAGPALEISTPKAVGVNSVAGFTLRGNTFNAFTTPVSLLIDGGITTVHNNTFTGFNLPSGSFESAVLSVAGLIGSGGDDPVYITRNVFSGNTQGGSALNDNLPREAIVYMSYAQFNFYSNRLYNNTAEAMVTVNQWDDVRLQVPSRTNAEARIFSSSFNNNTIINSGARSVINLYQGARFRFVNNTVTNHNLSDASTGSIINVGGLNSPITHFDATSGLAFFHDWEIHNNLFYDNTFNASSTSGNLIEFSQTHTIGCFDFTGTADPDKGARNNWFIYTDYATPSNPNPIDNANRPDRGDCAAALADPSNNNTFTELTSAAEQAAFVTTNFFGTTSDPIDPFRLRPTSFGIDAGDDQFASSTVFDDPYIAGTNLFPDALGLTRIITRIGGLPDIDLGAYELSDPQPLVVSGTQTVNATEDPSGGFISFTLGQGVVTGGILPLRYTITSQPSNFNASATSPCSGVAVQYDTATNQAAYCPPADFFSYTPGGGVVTFTYLVTDALGEASATGTVVIDLAPVNDPTDGGTFGTLGAPQVVFTDVLTPTNYRLRPYFDFNNFRLSDQATTNGRDYPFTFENAIFQSGNPNLLGANQAATIAALNAALTAAGSNGGFFIVNPIPGNTGELVFSYTARDRDSHTGTGFLRLIITQRLAGIGLHDDVSLDFIYSAGWAPLYWETANNNSLHFTSTLNEQIDFYFSGDTFIINAMGLPSGGNYEITIDPDGDGGQDFAFPQALGLTCSPEVNPATGIVSTLRSTLLFFSAGCRGLDTSFASNVHILRIKHKSAGLFTFIDSIEIRGAALSGGYYEERDFSLSYAGTWADLVLVGPKGGSMRYTTTLGSTISFQYNAASSDAIVVYYTSYPGWGNMRVCASGGGCASINQNGLFQWGKRKWISDTELNIGGSTGIHTITITPTIGGLVTGLEALYIHSQPNGIGTPIAPSPTVYEDSNAAFYYIGAWAFISLPSAIGGSAQYTVDPSASVMFNINSDAYGVAVYRTNGTGISPMEICINDLCQTFITGGSTVFADTAVMRVGSPGPHIVEIRNTSAAFFDIEAVRVLGAAGALAPGFYEETEAAADFNLTYSGSWTNLVTSSLIGGSARLTTSSSASLSFKINTAAVERIGIYRIQATGWSNFNVCASGGTCVQVINNNPIIAAGRVAIITTANLGIAGTNLDHTITITSLTNGAPAAIEAFELRGPQGPLVPGYYEEKDHGANLNLIYNGAWSDFIATGPRGGSGRYATTTTSTISFQYDANNADGILIYHTVAPGWGTLQVCNGATCVSITQTGTTALYGQRRWITEAELGSPAGIVTITIKPSANGPFAGIEALYIHAASNGLGLLTATNPTPYEETDPLLRYVGTWTNLSIPQLFGGSSKYTTDPTGSIIFNIDSASFGVALYRTAGSSWGGVEICIDAVCQTYGGRVSATSLYGDIVSARTTSAGTHFVEIRNVGATALNVEAIRVLGAVTPLGIGFYEDTEASASFNMTYSGNWNFFNIVGMVGNDAHYTTSTASQLSFQINSAIVKQIIVFRPTAPSGWSNLNVCAVTAGCKIVNNTSAGVAYGVAQIITLSDLSIVADNIYTITINSVTPGSLAAIEAIQLTPAPAALGPGYYEASESGTGFNMTFTNTWTTLNTLGPRGGSERYASSTSSTASFSYNGTLGDGLMIYFTKSPGRGQLEVCGAICAPVDIDQNSVSVQWGQRRWYTEAELGITGSQNYTITVSPATNGLVAGIDAFYIHGNNSISTPLTVNASPYQENNVNLRYIGTWTTVPYVAFNGGSAASTVDPSGAIMFNIDVGAAGVAVYRSILSTLGPAEVCIDSTCQTFAGTGATVFQDTSALLRVANDTVQHVVEIRSTSTAGTIVEAIQVIAAFSPLAIGYYEETEQATSFNLAYSGPWFNWAVAGTLGGTARAVGAANATATFRINANAIDRIVIFRSTASGWGSFEVCSELVGGFGGGPCKLVTNDSAVTTYGVPIILTKADLNLGASTNIHTITIRTLSAAFVSIEALQILGTPGAMGLGYYEETEIATSFNLTYTGAWSTLVTPLAMGGTARFTSSNTATATFTIDSTQVKRIGLFRTIGPGWGDIQVCGTTCAPNIVNSNATTVYGVPALINTSTLGTGTFQVTIKGVTNGAFIDIEALQLLGDPAPLAPGYYEETEASSSFGLTYAPSGWTSLATVGPRGGSMRYTNNTASTVTFTYDPALSDGIAIYHPSFTVWGDMEVCPGAAPCVTVDQNSTNGWNRRTWITEAQMGSPVTTITVTIRPKTNGQYIGFDAIYVHAASNGLGTLGVNATPYEDNNPNFRYIGTWMAVSGASFFGGNARYSSDTSASMMFNIDNTAFGIAVYRTTDLTYAPMEICIDQDCQVFPAAAATIYSDVVFFRVGTPGPHVVEIKTTGTGGNFNIEAVRVLGAETPLPPGLYQENDPNLVFTGTWTTYTSTLFNGSTMRFTSTPNHMISFRIGGGTTGMIIFTTRLVGGAPMEVCYTPQLPAPGTQVCTTEQTNNAVTQYTFGFATFGLNNKQLAPNQANDQEYLVTIRHAGTAGQGLGIEAIAVLGTTTMALTAGTYDDAAAGIVYSPSTMWLSGSAAGYLNNTWRFALYAGMVVQVRFTGNSITVFQLASGGSTTRVNACLVIPVTTGNQLQCANFSQNSSTAAFGTPITVYGFGFGTHEFVLENEAAASFSVDTIQIR